MKLTFLITERLIEMGVERPSSRLTAELERLTAPKVERFINATVTRRLVARAFAATLAGKGGLGEPTPTSSNKNQRDELRRLPEPPQRTTL